MSKNPFQAAARPSAFLVTYGDTSKHQFAMLDRARAEHQAATVHGVLDPLSRMPDLRALYEWAADPKRQPYGAAFPAGSIEQDIAMVFTLAEERRHLEEVSS
ncbi:hypothetical protein [Caldimonas brevitalea]|uniref:Uncharacterized protein n=1 Tax=Caldimonas brevitalea TaxID=413882 RepID=A0A0G3BLE8_9BURK|nr:hypothetical protein [Caldimonas brevitalea]AKJ28778.1 hypothetical protein AAW51_2087 [Caldimonas brevitalea]